MSRPPLPPFDAEAAAIKARLAEDAWNSRDPVKVSLAYTDDSRWRNRADCSNGRGYSGVATARRARRWSRP